MTTDTAPAAPREAGLLNAAVVVAVDTPSDRPMGMNGAFRLSPAHAQDLAP